MITKLVLSLALLTSSCFAQEINIYIDRNGEAHGLGYIHGTIGFGGAEWESFENDTVLLPESFDSRSLGWQTPVKNQGGCGSCWAHAIAQNLETALLRERLPMTELSPQQMVDCDYQAWGCNGGTMYDGMYAVQTGLTGSDDYPYVGYRQNCKLDGKPIKGKAARFVYVGAPNRSPTTEELKKAVFKYGALFVTVSAGGSDWDGRAVMNNCWNSQLNHMVEIVGWTKDSKWIMRNSWGTNWGDKGYAYLPYGCDGIAVGAGTAAFLTL